MTQEEAIKYLTPIVESARLPGYKAALGLALEALRGCALCVAVCNPAEINHVPLTADELRLMEGRPVYCISDYEITVTGGKGHRAHTEEWGIVTGTDLGDQGFIVGTACMYYLQNYGKTWVAYRNKPTDNVQPTATRFDRIRACQTPEEMAVELNANGRRFCPKEYSRKEPTCAVPCGECIVEWLREEAGK